MKYLVKKCIWLLPLLFSGCFNSCKYTVEPANSILDPELAEVSMVNGQEDPLIQKQWAITTLGLENVWKEHHTTKKVTVAVVGSGVDYNHEDLRSNIFVNLREASHQEPASTQFNNGVDEDANGYVDDIVGYDFVDNDGYPFDRNGTGTAIAGVIGAVHNNGLGIKGINEKVSMIPVRYIDSNGLTNIPRLASALEYVAVIKPDVVSLHLANLKFGPESIRGTEYIALKSILQKIRRQGTPIIASAGNLGKSLNNKNSIIALFSSFDNVMIITTVDQNDERPFIANYGPQIVKLAAPGENVMTTAPGNNYQMANGSSIAAAHVAGALALAISEHFGSFTTAGFFDVMLSEKGSDFVPDLEHEILSGSRLNIEKFLSQLKR